MSLSAAVLDALVKSGATQEMLVAAMKADIEEREAIETEKLEAKRLGNRERQQRKRGRDSNAVSRVTSVTERDGCDISPKERDQTPSSKTKEPKGSSSKAVDVPDWMPPAEWEAFKEMRRKMRGVPFTQSAERTVIAKLATLKAEGHDPAKLLSKAVERGHRTVFEDDTTRAAKNGKVQRTAQEWRESAEWYVRHGQQDRAEECRRAAVAIEQRAIQ